MGVLNRGKNVNVIIRTTEPSTEHGMKIYLFLVLKIKKKLTWCIMRAQYTPSRMSSVIISDLKIKNKIKRIKQGARPRAHDKETERTAVYVLMPYNL